MINKNLSKLIGIKKEEFDNYLLTCQIQLQPARLIPALKTGDEMALTSIFFNCSEINQRIQRWLFQGNWSK